jgi:hypothetical protein
MQGSQCPGCGAPVAAGAQFCPSCGTPFPGGPAPSPPPGALGPAPSTAPANPALEPYVPWRPPRRRRSWVLVVIAVLVILLLVALLAVPYLETSKGPATVTVHYVVLYSPDNVCGLDVGQFYYGGFNLTSGHNGTYGFEVENFNSSSCKIQGATTNTSGFTFLKAEVPIAILSTYNVTMLITIQAPSYAYDGNMNLVLT